MSAFRPFALRDAVVVAATVALWVSAELDERWWHIATGLLTGVCALLFHEWGHLYGAHRAGAVITPSPIWSPFLCNVSSTENDREQFLVLSLWGFYATGVFVVLFGLWLPRELLAGKIAMTIAVVLATLTVVIEFPIAWRVYKGYPIPRVEIFRK